MEIGKRIAGLFKFRNKKKGERKSLKSANKKTVYNGGQSVDGFNDEKSRYRRINGKLIEKEPFDFGYGFYTAVERRHAMEFVLKEAKKNKRYGVLNTFTFNLDKAIADGLDVEVFDKADDKWFDFVWKNRTDRTFEHTHDIVIGPTADMDMIEYCRMYAYQQNVRLRKEQSGTIGKKEREQLLEKEHSIYEAAKKNVLKKQYPTQVFFHNKNAYDMELVKIGEERYDQRRRKIPF